MSDKPTSGVDATDSSAPSAGGGYVPPSHRSNGYTAPDLNPAVGTVSDTDAAAEAEADSIAESAGAAAPSASDLYRATPEAESEVDLDAGTVEDSIEADPLNAETNDADVAGSSAEPEATVVDASDDADLEATSEADDFVVADNESAQPDWMREISTPPAEASPLEASASDFSSPDTSITRAVPENATAPIAFAAGSHAAEAEDSAHENLASASVESDSAASASASSDLSGYAPPTVPAAEPLEPTASESSERPAAGTVVGAAASGIVGAASGALGTASGALSGAKDQVARNMKPPQRPQGSGSAVPPPPSAGAEAPRPSANNPLRAGLGDMPRPRGHGPSWAQTVAMILVGCIGTALLTGLFTQWSSGSASISSVKNTKTVDDPAPAGPVTSGTNVFPDWIAVADAVAPSVVAIKVSSDTRGSAEGSGVVLDTDGTILTNNHVVAPAAGSGEIVVVFQDGSGFDATIVGRDELTDLAVLRLKQRPDGLTPIAQGNSDEVRVGDPVMAVGNPLGLADTVTTGIVSALNRPVTTGAAGDTGQSQTTNSIQTDAAINPGNSGGALVDMQGRLVGINSAIAALSGSLGGASGNIGLGFAIPVNEAREVANQLLQDGVVDHARLGVILDPTGESGTAVVDDVILSGARVNELVEGAAAAGAGVQVDDLIIALDDQRLQNSDALVAAIRAQSPGDSVTLTIVRDASKLELTVTLGSAG